MILTISSNPFPMSRNLFLLVLLQVVLLVSFVNRRLILECLAVLGADFISVILWLNVVLLFCVRSGGEVINLWLVYGRTRAGSAHPFADPQLIVSQILRQFLFQAVLQVWSIHSNAVVYIVLYEIV